jgi:hypothetical protein
LHAISPTPLCTTFHVLLSCPTTLPHICCSPGCPPVTLTRANSSILSLSHDTFPHKLAVMTPPSSPIGSLALAWYWPFPQVQPTSALLDLLPFISTNLPRVASLIALMAEAAETSETLVNSYQSTWCFNPDNSHLHISLRLTLTLFNAFNHVNQEQHGVRYQSPSTN